jgi:hypothetical protein
MPQRCGLIAEHAVLVLDDFVQRGIETYLPCIFLRPKVADDPTVTQNVLTYRSPLDFAHINCSTASSLALE